MKAGIYSLLLAFTALFTFSCTDHEVPGQKVYPTIETLPYQHQEEDGPDDDYFVDIKSLGNQPIMEYGIVANAQPESSNVEPTVEDKKFPFSPTPEPGVRKQPITRSQLPYIPGDHKRSYRAYIITSDGTVRYGQTISKMRYVLDPIEKEYPTIETPEYSFISEDSKDIILHVNFQTLGNQPITEYGVVFSIQDVNSNVLPTVADTKFAFTALISLGLKNQQIPYGDLPYKSGSFKRVYRAYVMTSDGTIVYGNEHSGVIAPL